MLASNLEAAEHLVRGGTRKHIFLSLKFIQLYDSKNAQGYKKCSEEAPTFCGLCGYLSVTENVRSMLPFRIL